MPASPHEPPSAVVASVPGSPCWPAFVHSAGHPCQHGDRNGTPTALAIACAAYSGCLMRGADRALLRAQVYRDFALAFHCQS